MFISRFFLFGSNTPDALILVLLDVLAAVFLYKLVLRFGLSPKIAMLETLFALICSNMVFVIIDPSVWFIAQVMCFALAVMSIYFAVAGKGGRSLALWACAVGCRPMQALYLLILLIILFYKEKEKQGPKRWYWICLRKWGWGILPMIIAVSYMTLNNVRFGSPLEFGHNYLPEFMYVHKQFSLAYVKNNVRMLFHLPDFSDNGTVIIDHFGNLNFLIASPVILFSLIAFFFLVFRRNRSGKEIVFSLGVLLLSAGYLFVLLMHAAMGDGASGTAIRLT